MALDNFLNANGVCISQCLNPLNCFSGYLLPKAQNVSHEYLRGTSKMTPKWQKSLSAVEIDYSDCRKPHSSWGDSGDRCCFSSTKITLMPVYWCWIQKPKSENVSIIHQRQRRLCWSCPYRQKSLSLSHKRAFLLAFSSVSHLLTELLITVGDSAQPAATINTWFLLT